MPLLLLLLALQLPTPEPAPAPDAVTDAIAAYRAATRVAVRCREPADESEVVVCANREKDQWRSPFITVAAGDPRRENVPGERARLIEQDGRMPCSYTPFLADCGGMVGVSVGIGFDGKVERIREPAP